MKNLDIKFTWIVCFVFGFYHAKSQTFEDSLLIYFKQIKKTTAKHKAFWHKDLHNPILVVNPQTREVYANEADASAYLKQSGKIYKGILPDSVNIANTAAIWNSKKWAMLMLPLPNAKADRINLMAHELFHVAQPSLGFTLNNPDNNHLDKKEGRIYLILELEALKKAIIATHPIEQKKHISNALLFRQYRRIVYPEASKTENDLELNEGLAEYTGLVLSNRNKDEIKRHFELSISQFYKNPTFVRSFAYQTIPMYGIMLRNNFYRKRTTRDWHLNIKNDTDLTEYLIGLFEAQLKGDLDSTVQSIIPLYNGKVIIEEETAREEKAKQLIAAYKKKFVEQTHWDIPFIAMNMSYDPRNITPLDNLGTVYPNIRITDKWGILTVEKGALMSPNWDKITVTPPQYIEKNLVKGDGWILELSETYSVEKEENTGFYFLRKK